MNDEIEKPSQATPLEILTWVAFVLSSPLSDENEGGLLDSNSSLVYNRDTIIEAIEGIMAVADTFIEKEGDEKCN